MNDDYDIIKFIPDLYNSCGMLEIALIFDFNILLQYVFSVYYNNMLNDYISTSIIITEPYVNYILEIYNNSKHLMLEYICKGSLQNDN